MKKTTHAIFVLDRSGSMQSCQDATIDGYNEQLNAFRKGKAKVKITCIQFDQNAGKNDIEVLYENADAKSVADLNRDTYQPRGGTPMLDAVAQAIGVADKDTVSDSVLITIFSDGQENASREETYASIAEKIKTRTAKGNWTFAYIGANQDLSVISQRMNIPIGNTMAYAATDMGTRSMYDTTNHSRMMFAASASLGSSNLFGTEPEPAPKNDINSKINRRAATSSGRSR